MGDTSAPKMFLYALNSILILLSLGLIASSLWFFVQVYEFTSLRNSNHYILDYKVYWPQVIPWMFFIIGAFVLAVSCFGIFSAVKNNRGLVNMYIGFGVFVMVIIIIAAALALVFADSKTTDEFVKDTVWDVYFRSKHDEHVASAYGSIERKLRCCGADSPRDYRNWKEKFPVSCCDTHHDRWKSMVSVGCPITDKFANEKYGCTTVASQYARITIKALSAVSVFTAAVVISAVAVAVSLSKTLEKNGASVMAA